MPGERREAARALAVARVLARRGRCGDAEFHLEKAARLASPRAFWFIARLIDDCFMKRART
jgi:hypothetical protein